MDNECLTKILSALGEKIGMLEYQLDAERKRNKVLMEQIEDLTTKEANNNGNGNRSHG